MTKGSSDIPQRESYVSAGDDLLGSPHRVFGSMRIDRKVSAEQTGGELLMIEHTDVESGGPPRHLHHRQDEWFYILEGEYVIEVGSATHRLSPGDSLLAPRGVPHVWAYRGVPEGESTRGRLLIGFRPAGKMESFFAELAKLAAPQPDVLRPLFSAHGMELLGPPLDVSQDRP